MSHPDALQDYEPDFEEWAAAQDPFDEPHYSAYSEYLMDRNNIGSSDGLVRHMEAGTDWDGYLESVFFKKEVA